MGETTAGDEAQQRAAGTPALAAALVAALGKMRNPPKNRTVEVSTRGGGKYGFRYATLDKILDMARPVLADEGLALFQPITTNDKGGLVLVTRLLHRSGESMESLVPLPAPGSDPQAFGAAVTYLRRYAVTALLGVASDEDTDGAAAAGNALQDAEGSRHARRRVTEDRVLADLIERARHAETVEDAHALLAAWDENAAAVEAKRGTEEWDAAVSWVKVGLNAALGGVPAAAFGNAIKMATPEHVRTYEAAWNQGGRWHDELRRLEREAHDVWLLLRRHAAAQGRRAEAAPAPPRVAPLTAMDAG